MTNGLNLMLKGGIRNEKYSLKETDPLSEFEVYSAVQGQDEQM